MERHTQQETEDSEKVSIPYNSQQGTETLGPRALEELSPASNHLSKLGRGRLLAEL